MCPPFLVIVDGSNIINLGAGAATDEFFSFIESPIAPITELILRPMRFLTVFATMQFKLNERKNGSG